MTIHFPRFLSYFACMSLILCQTVTAQDTGVAYPGDVASIDAIIDAYYDVFSGHANDPWQYERDKYLHADDAVIVRLNDHGEAVVNSLEDEYVAILLVPRESLFEVELHRIVQQFGNMAHVWSTYEVRREPDGPAIHRGINSIQLYFSKDRWWISGWTVQTESESSPIPARYLNKE